MRLRDYFNIIPLLVFAFVRPVYNLESRPSAREQNEPGHSVGEQIQTGPSVGGPIQPGISVGEQFHPGYGYATEREMHPGYVVGGQIPPGSVIGGQIPPGYTYGGQMPVGSLMQGIMPAVVRLPGGQLIVRGPNGWYILPGGPGTVGQISREGHIAGFQPVTGGQIPPAGQISTAEYLPWGQGGQTPPVGTVKTIGGQLFMRGEKGWYILTEAPVTGGQISGAGYVLAGQTGGQIVGGQTGDQIFGGQIPPVGTVKTIGGQLFMRGEKGWYILTEAPNTGGQIPRTGYVLVGQTGGQIVGGQIPPGSFMGGYFPPGPGKPISLHIGSGETELSLGGSGEVKVISEVPGETDVVIGGPGRESKIKITSGEKYGTQGGSHGGYGPHRGFREGGHEMPGGYHSGHEACYHEGRHSGYHEGEHGIGSGYQEGGRGMESDSQGGRHGIHNGYHEGEHGIGSGYPEGGRGMQSYSQGGGHGIHSDNHEGEHGMRSGQHEGERGIDSGYHEGGRVMQSNSHGGGDEKENHYHAEGLGTHSGNLGERTGVQNSYPGEIREITSGNHGGVYPGTYTGVQPGGHPGTNTEIQPGGYPGTYTGVQPGGYPGTYPKVQSDVYPGVYNRTYPGVYSGTYTGVVPGGHPGTYTGVQLGGYPGTHTGVQPGRYPGTYPRVQSDVYPGGYDRTYPGVYSGTHTGVQPGGHPETNTGVQPGGYPGTYTGVQPGRYPGTYPKVQSDVYPGGYNRTYPGVYPGTYTGVEPGGYPGAYPGTYPKVQSDVYPGGHNRTYPGVYPGTYTGAQPGGYPGTYAGARPGGYPGIYTGAQPGGYPGTQPGGYPGTYPRAQSDVYPGGYNRTYPGVYPGTYTGVQPGGYPGTYTGVQPGGYPGTYTGVQPGRYPGTYPRVQSEVYPGGFRYIYPAADPGGYRYINPGMYPAGSGGGGYMPTGYMSSGNMASGNMSDISNDQSRPTREVYPSYPRVRRSYDFISPPDSKASGKEENGSKPEHHKYEKADTLHKEILYKSNLGFDVSSNNSSFETSSEKAGVKPTSNPTELSSVSRNVTEISSTITGDVSSNPTELSSVSRSVNEISSTISGDVSSNPTELSPVSRSVNEISSTISGDVSSNPTELSSVSRSVTEIPSTNSDDVSSNRTELSSVSRNVTEISSTISRDASSKITTDITSLNSETSSISIDTFVDDIKYTNSTRKIEDVNKNENPDTVSTPLLNITVTPLVSNITENNSSGTKENVTSDNLTTEVYSSITENSSNTDERTLNNVTTDNESSEIHPDQTSVMMNATLSPMISLNLTDDISTDFHHLLYKSHTQENVSVTENSITTDKSTLSNSEGNHLSTQAIDDESAEQDLKQTSSTFAGFTSILSTVTDNVSMETDNTANGIYKSETRENVSGMNYRNYPLSTFETNSTVINENSSSKVNTMSDDTAADNTAVDNTTSDNTVSGNIASDNTGSDTYSPSLKELTTADTYSYESSVSQENANFAAEVSSNASETSLESNITDLARSDIYSTSVSKKLNEISLNDSLVNNDHTEGTKQKENENITDDDILNKELQANVSDSIISENNTSINSRREIIDLEPHSLDTKNAAAENNTDDSEEMPGNIPTEFSIHIGKASIVTNNNTGRFESIVFNNEHSDWGIINNTFLDVDNISDISNTSTRQQTDINEYKEPNTNNSSFLNATYDPVQETSTSISRLLAVFNHSDEIFFRNADQDKGMGLELNGINGPKDTEPISEYKRLSFDSNSNEFPIENVTRIIKDKETARAEKPSNYPLPFYLIKNNYSPNSSPKKINNEFANLNSVTESNLENITIFFSKATDFPKMLSDSEFQEVDTFSYLKYTYTPDEIENNPALSHQEAVNDLAIQPSYEKRIIKDENDQKEKESPVIVDKDVIYGLISTISPFQKINDEKVSDLQTNNFTNSEKEINDFSTISMRLNETEILNSFSSDNNQDLNVNNNKSLSNTLYHDETSSLGEFPEIFYSNTNMNPSSSVLEEKMTKDTKLYYVTTASEIKENISVTEHDNDVLKKNFSEMNNTENYKNNVSSTAKQGELLGLTTLHSTQVSANAISLKNINISLSHNTNMSQKDARFAKSLDNHISSFDQNSTISNGNTNENKNLMKHQEGPKAMDSSMSKLIKLCHSAGKRCNRRLLERCLTQLRNESDSNCNRISYDDVIIAADGRNPTNKERLIKDHSQRCFRRIKKSCSRETFDCIVDVFYVKENRESALLMC